MSKVTLKNDSSPIAKEKSKKKKRNVHMDTGRINNVRFVRNFRIMDGMKLGQSGNVVLTKILFREICNYIDMTKLFALRNGRKSVTPEIVRACARLRLSNRDRKVYDEFEAKLLPLLPGGDE